MISKSIYKETEKLTSQLYILLASPIVKFDQECRGNLPNQPGIYRIFWLDRQSDTIRAGRTDKTLRQRIYANHLMGNQAGNLRTQLVNAKYCVDLDDAKNFIRRNLAVQFISVLNTEERVSLEHFILAVLHPKLGK